MRWTEFHPDLKKLYNLIGTTFSETVSDKTSLQAQEEVSMLMEKLTEKLNLTES